MGKQPTNSKDISKEKMTEVFKRVLSNYIPVLKNVDELDEKYHRRHQEEYPAS